MPAVFKYVMNHDVMRFAKVAVRVWGCQMNFEFPDETALEGIACFRSFLHSIGMPINFEQLGAKEDDIPKLVRKFGIGDGKTGGFVHLSSEDVAKIYNIAADAQL
jgi:alcohol dehydrogenase YqhD (iron-dependent ADH family)